MMPVLSFLSTGKRRRWWLPLLMLVVLSAGGIAWYRNTPRQNIILVTFDTTRADRLGAYGYNQGFTEAFDEFARQGVVFEQTYAPAPITLPSHATMLTGLYPPEHGLRVNGAGQLPREIPFLPEILQQHGFDTGAFVAAAVLDSKYGLDRGFDHYDDEITRSAEQVGESRRDGKEVVDAALKWLEQRTQKPFFCWIHLYDAHAPYNPRTEAYQQKFVEHPYDAGVAWEVKQFGRLMEFLKASRLDSKTVVVIAGDHGEGLDDHMENEHGMLVYNSTLQVPLVFVGPQRDFLPGTRVPQAVSLADLMPTLTDLLQVPAPKHLSGRSLRGALKGQPLDPRDCYAEAETPFILNRWAPLRTVISGRWKYIQTTRPELYDLEQDPGELTNLAATAEAECERLRNRLMALQEQFQIATAQNVELSEKDIANLQALGYLAGGKGDAASDPNSVEILPDVKDFLPLLAKFEKAKHLAREGTHSAAELEEATALLREVVQSTQDFPMAELILGDCLAQAGHLDEAEQTYSALLARRPDFLKARLNLGRIYRDQGRWELAAVQFRELIQEDPGAATMHLELAQSLTQLQQFDEAQEEYRTAIRLAPELAMASVQLGRLYLQLRRPAEAQACWEEALKHAPQSVDVRAHLMMVLAQTGQNDKAIQQGRELVELDPRSFDTRFNLGNLLIAQQRFGEGIAQLRAAQKLRPNDPRPGRQILQAEAAMKKIRKGQ